MSEILLREEIEDGIVQVTLNRPERLNALSQRLIAELHEAFAALALDRGCRAVVLTGAGRGFCAGADVRGNPGETGAPGTEEMGQVARVFLTHWRWPATSASPRPRPVSARASSRWASRPATWARATSCRVWSAPRAPRS